jgi:multiple sugar transport system ATP-binding protein
MADVAFHQVSKRYGETAVLSDLTLDVADHEFMVLVGPSGCGKSTALRMLAGLEEISGGTITIGGRVVNDVPPRDRDIAMVFQNYALYPHMTVAENLSFGLRLRHTPRAEVEQSVAESAELLGITHLLDRRPKELSGGQRQRVAVGRAIVRHPAVFLFDEPLSNLDAKLRGQMRAEIIKLQQRLGTTSIYVTHDQVEAMTMGHRIAVMRDGKLQQVGPPLEVYGRPKNLFVASFIGTPGMNLLQGTVEEMGQRIAAAGLSLPVPAELSGRLATGRKIVVGIRPGDIGYPGSGNSDAVRLEGTAELVEPLGHEVVLHLKVGSQLLVAVVDARSVPRSGDAVELEIRSRNMHLFDAASEERIDGA